MIGASHIFCLENSIFRRILYCYYIVAMGFPGWINSLYYYDIFLLGESTVKSGSARTLYPDDKLWEQLLQLVGFSRANILAAGELAFSKCPQSGSQIRQNVGSPQI